MTNKKRTIVSFSLMLGTVVVSSVATVTALYLTGHRFGESSQQNSNENGSSKLAKNETIQTITSKELPKL